MSTYVRWTACVSLAALLVTLPVARQANAELAISANDNKVRNVNGAMQVQANPPSDTITLIEFGKGAPKVLGEVSVPTSVVGPPVSVAITPDEGLALVTAAMKVDPADPTKQVPDNKLSVVDLKASPPAVIATLEAGPGASGVSINLQGTLALVANRSGSTVSVFSIDGKTVTKVGDVGLGNDKANPSHAAISPDGTLALVTRDGDSRVSILSIAGTKVEYTKKDIFGGVKPDGIDISPDGKVAVFANVGGGQGDADTVSVVDLAAKPPRVVDTFTVGPTPEGIKLSPDGKWCAVVLINGSNRPKESPLFHDNGLLLLYRVNGTKLTKVAEAPVGHWAQGPAFSADGRTILVSNMVERNVMVFRWDGKKLTKGAAIAVNGGSAAVRVADKPRKAG